MVSGNWFNNDGLYLEYGTAKPTIDVAGEYKTYGDMREINIRLDLTTLTTTPAIISQNLKFPNGMRIARIEVIADTAATSGGTPTLDLGLQKDDRTTELDYNGLIAALALTSIDALGETNSLVVGSTGAGALMGTVLTDVGAYLTANSNSATYTAGVLNIRIFLYGRGTITQ